MTNGKVRVIEIKQSVFENNDREADRGRAQLKKEHTFLLNLMSSPGSGKTTTLKATIARLKNKLRIGVMEADIDSDVDALAIAETGVRSIQLHTGGMCSTSRYSRTLATSSARRSSTPARSRMSQYSPCPRATTSRSSTR